MYISDFVKEKKQKKTLLFVRKIIITIFVCVAESFLLLPPAG